MAVVGEFARLLSFAGLRVFTPAVLIVLLSGLWLVLAGSEWNLTQTWVLVALAAFAAAFLIGALYLSRSPFGSNVSPSRRPTSLRRAP